MATRCACWLALLWCSGAAAQVRPFGPGEQTTYEVSYLGLRAGVAQVTVGWQTEAHGTAVWPLVCAVRTVGLAVAYPVDDRFVSYWSPAARRPVGADFFVNENGKRRRERYRYDEAQRRAFTTKQREGEAKVDGEYEIAAGTMDLAAAAFALREEPLEVGQVRLVPIFTGHRSYTMRAAVEARERVEGPLGAFDALRVAVSSDFSGGLRAKQDMRVWYTDDGRRVPIRAEADFFLGAIRVEAVRFEPGLTAGGG